MTLLVVFRKTTLRTLLIVVPYGTVSFWYYTTRWHQSRLNPPKDKDKTVRTTDYTCFTGLSCTFYRIYVCSGACALLLALLCYLAGVTLRRTVLLNSVLK